MKLQIITNNAYRILGVAAPASMRDIECNKSRFRAFLNIDRPVPPQPLDFPQLLGDVNRDSETIRTAESEISLPAGKLAQGMFWFVRKSPLDDECFKVITNGDISEAERKWVADGSVSSLQNILICMLIGGRCKEAVLLARNIYTVHFDKWKAMYSLLTDTSATDVSKLFLDRLYSEIPKDIISMDWDGISDEWEFYVKKKSISPITDKIKSLIEECHNSNRDNPKLRYKGALNMLDTAQPLLTQLEHLLKPDDITLVSMEDNVYTEALNCSIASYNAAYDELKNGNGAQYRLIAPQCKDILNRINSNFVSPAVAKRIEDNKKIINENCSDIEKTIEEHIAFNENICWFCGSYGETQEYRKPYSYSESTPTWNGTKITTYTKTVTFRICKECLKELDEQKNWKMYTAGGIFLLFALIILIAFDFWMDFGFYGWLFLVLTLGTLSLLIGFSAGYFVREMLDKQNIREFKRSTEEHPLVKLVKKQGYH